ncbi:hypothetical protein ACFY3E_00390 [Streptomyces griseorubiginosus]|uniref:hypothetical protein n=1 Tax=Streptomyces griseorubiginosus TaxID=67304 RepID=UPI00367B54FD
MRRTTPVLGVLMIVVGVLVAVLSMWTYADKGERLLAERRLDLAQTDQDREVASDELQRVENRERLNISMAVGGSVLATGGGAVLVSVRRRRAAEAGLLPG